jgi:outer membrane protein assembly factor BamB
VTLLLALATGACGQSGGSTTASLSRGAKQSADLAARETHALRCLSDTWPVYAHDAQRTGTSTSCCRGPLEPLWRYDPPDKPARKARLLHAVVSADAIYASGTIGESPAVFAVALDGTTQWVFDSRVDITHHEWPAYVLDRVILNDDGLYILDPRTGQQEVDRGLDAWGQVMSDGKVLLAANTWFVAGPRTYVGALEVGGAPLWKRNERGAVREDTRDRLGGIALAAERLVFAPNYAPAQGSGLYAYAIRNGAPLWKVPTTPKSHPSVSGDTVCLTERPDGTSQDIFSCRDVENGRSRFSHVFALAEPTPPLVVGDLLIVRDESGAVIALLKRDGNEAWRAALARPAVKEIAWATSMVAITRSDTLLAVDGADIAFLSLTDGRLLWRGRPANLRASLHSPVVSGGRVYVIDGASLVALGCSPP